MASNDKLKRAFERVAREFDRVDADIAALAARGTLPEEMTIEWVLYQMWETLKNKDHCCNGGGSSSVEIYQQQAAAEQLSTLDKLRAENQMHLVETSQPAAVTGLSPETIALREQLAAIQGSATTDTPDDDFIADEAPEETGA